MKAEISVHEKFDKCLRMVSVGEELICWNMTTVRCNLLVQFKVV